MIKRPIIIGVDLDRTLIYSNRFLEMHPISEKSKAISVEKTDKTESFISKSVVDKINAISNAYQGQIIVVPVTSRSKQEYDRIKIPDLKFKYAITSAGGTILCDGVPSEDWVWHIDKLIDLDGMDNLMHQLNALNCTNYKSKVIDRVYVFSKVNNIREAKEELNTLRKCIRGFDIQMDKHKIYATNSGINKGSALLWLKDRLGASSIITFGDSMMDIPMMSVADKAFTPTHTTIEEQIIQENGIEVVGGNTECMLSVLDWAIENMD